MTWMGRRLELAHDEGGLGHGLDGMEARASTR